MWNFSKALCPVRHILRCWYLNTDEFFDHTGTTQVDFSQGFGYQFIGIIDASAAGFTHFEFREVDGKIGQALFIFGDDFTFTGTPILADGDLAPWDNPDGLINVADILIAQQLVLGLRISGDLQYAHGDMNGDNVIDVADLILIIQAVQ